jgi:catechol 2,3-dioxygenase-like lactoylglutathione lyase family enzyme
MPILDHITINVHDYARAKEFYEKALAPLGIKVVKEFGKFCGFGADGKPDFWIGMGKASYQTDAQLADITPIHVAFVAKDRASVDAFYAAAMAAGAKDHGAPGVRRHYHDDYYGAFVLDPDGHNIEAVCHRASA